MMPTVLRKDQFPGELANCHSILRLSYAPADVDHHTYYMIGDGSIVPASGDRYHSLQLTCSRQVDPIVTLAASGNDFELWQCNQELARDPRVPRRSSREPPSGSQLARHGSSHHPPGRLEVAQSSLGSGWPPNRRSSRHQKKRCVTTIRRDYPRLHPLSRRKGPSSCACIVLARPLSSRLQIQITHHPSR